MIYLEFCVTVYFILNFLFNNFIIFLHHFDVWRENYRANSTRLVTWLELANHLGAVVMWLSQKSLTFIRFLVCVCYC